MSGRNLAVSIRDRLLNKARAENAFDFAKYANRYLAEVQYRFNRRFDLSSILKRLLVAAVVTPPRSERFLRAAEHCG